MLGHTGGTFSLEGPEGKAFHTRSRVFTVQELEELDRSPTPWSLPLAFRYSSPIRVRAKARSASVTRVSGTEKASA